MNIITIECAINGRHLESIAESEIYPGMLLQRSGAGRVQPHSTADGIAPPLIAIENRFAGKNVDTPYQIDNGVYMRYCLSGDTFWGRVYNGVPIEEGMLVTSKGDGTFIPIQGMPPYIDRSIVGRILLVSIPSLYPNTSWCKIEQ